MVVAYALASILVLEAWRRKNQATLEFEVQHRKQKRARASLVGHMAGFSDGGPSQCACTLSVLVNFGRVDGLLTFLFLGCHCYPSLWFDQNRPGLGP